jgi:hypothetical protein
MKKKIAILHPHFGWGGAEAVCVWTLYALKDKFDIDLIVTEKNVTIYKINQFYETNFSDHDFNIINICVINYYPRISIIHPCIRYIG